MARKRAADYEDKRELIRTEAARLFAAQGFARTSIESLAQACDASKSWLYHYYPSKEAVLYDLLKAHVLTLLAAAEEVTRDPAAPPAVRLRELVRALMRIYVRTEATHVVLLSDLGALAAAEQEEIVALQRRLVARFAGLVREIQPRVDGRPGLRAAVTMAFLGMINFTYTWFDAEGPVSPEEFADLATDLFLTGVGRFGDEG